MRHVLRALSALIAVAALSGPLTGCRGWTSDKPPVHWNPNMDTQEKGKAYRHDQSGLFADGRYMRQPPDGTVARGYLNDNDELATGMGPDGKPIAKLPDAFVVNATTAARGKDRYQVYCAPCHGKDADGKGLVAARPQALAVPPPSFKDPRLVEMPAGQFYKAIHVGVNNNNMPSYAAQIPVEDRWAIVAWLCTLEMDEADPKVACANKKAESTEGKHPGYIVWKTKGCNACHSDNGSPLVGPTFKGLWGRQEQTSAGAVTVDEAYFTESIKNPTAKVVNGFPPAMPALPLSDQEIADLISWLKTDPKMK